MKTAIQEVFSDLEKLHPNLFNVYTTEGKEFINHFHKYLAIEKEQIIDFGYDIAEDLAWGKYRDKKAMEERYNEYLTFKQQEQ